MCCGCRFEPCSAFAQMFAAERGRGRSTAGNAEMASRSSSNRRVDQDRRRGGGGAPRATDRPGRYPPVLVADSYEGARRPCARYLDRLNFEVIEAADGDEALARIVATPPHVILAEWFLPAMPAPRFAQWLGQSWRTREIPLIALASTVEPGAPSGIAAVL